MSNRPSMENDNVYKKPLALFSKSPMTGFYRDGYCRVGPEDKGNHSVASVLTEEFLDFTASRGNNLRSIGLKGGQKWCLCANRWKEAMEAASGENDPKVPKVFLHATSSKALDQLSMSDLRKFAAPHETTGAGGGVTPRGMTSPPVEEANKTGGRVREQHIDVSDRDGTISKEYRGA